MKIVNTKIPNERGKSNETIGPISTDVWFDIWDFSSSFRRMAELVDEEIQNYAETLNSENVK